MDVADWLRALGLEQYEAAFRVNGVTENIRAILLPTTSKTSALPPSAIGVNCWWQSLS
jgi:hypothetical protein